MMLVSTDAIRIVPYFPASLNTVSLCCDLFENLVYQSGKLFFEDDDQADKYNQDQNDLDRCNTSFVLKKCFYVCHIMFHLLSLSEYLVKYLFIP